MANDNQDVIGDLAGREATMPELDHFLTPTLARQFDAEQARINGNSGPRLAPTSTQNPVTMSGQSCRSSADG